MRTPPENPWDIDIETGGWIFWLTFFFVWEWYTSSTNQMFTHHIWWLRNEASESGASIILFLIYAILAWLNWHFIKEGWHFFTDGSVL